MLETLVAGIALSGMALVRAWRKRSAAARPAASCVKEAPKAAEPPAAAGGEQLEQCKPQPPAASPPPSPRIAATRCPAPVPRRATCSDSSGQESSGAEAAADNLPDSVEEFGAWVRESCRRRGEHPGERCSLTFTKREVIPWETVACPRRGLLRASLERCNSAPAAPQAAPSPRSALKQASSGSRAEGGAGGRQLRFA